MLRDGQVAGEDEGAWQCSSGGMQGSSDDAPVLMEESFTIHLGTQMKQMHNLRLVAADAVQLCAYDYSAHNGLVLLCVQ